MGTSTVFSFKSLLATAPRGQPLTTDWLSGQGLTAKHAARLVKDGWLRRVGHALYGFPGDSLDRDASLATLATLMPGLRVGGKTALNWRGVRHNLSARETLSLWGETSARLPEWFSASFPSNYQATHLFDAEMPPELGIAPLPGGRADVMVSTPERAILEVLSDIGKSQSSEEAWHLIEGVRSLRADVFEQLMAHLNRIKVARLAVAVSDELDLPWKAIARKHSARLGGGARWVSAGRTGDRLTLKKTP